MPCSRTRAIGLTWFVFSQHVLEAHHHLCYCDENTSPMIMGERAVHRRDECCVCPRPALQVLVTSICSCRSLTTTSGFASSSHKASFA